MVEQLELSELKKLYNVDYGIPKMFSGFVGFNMWLHEYCYRMVESNPGLTVNVMEGETVKYQFTKAKAFNDGRAPNELSLYD